MKAQFFVLLALCVVFNAGAHIMMKYAAMIKEGFWARNINPLGTLQIPVLFCVAACSFAVSIVFYMLLLKTAQLLLRLKFAQIIETDGYFQTNNKIFSTASCINRIMELFGKTTHSTSDFCRTVFQYPSKIKF